jgi:hypothetical protein
VAADDNLMLDWMRAGEFILNRSFCCSRVLAALTAIAINVAGCADSRLAANNAAANASSGTTQTQPSSGLYGGGFTTDLYTELFGSNQRDDRTAPSNEKSAPATASNTSASSTASPATVVSAPVPPNTVQQAQPAPTSGVRQEASAAEASPAQSTVYGIPSNGMTTDLFTELFGPRRRE